MSELKWQYKSVEFWGCFDSFQSALKRGILNKKNKMIVNKSRNFLEKNVSYLYFFLIMVVIVGCKKNNEISIIFKKNEVIKSVDWNKHKFSLKELQRGIPVSLRLINETDNMIEIFNEIEDQSAFGIGVQLTVQAKFSIDQAFHSIKFFNKSNSTNYGSKTTRFVHIVKSEVDLKIEKNQLKSFFIEPNKELKFAETMHELFLPKYTKWVKNRSGSNEIFYDFDRSNYIQINPHLIFSYRVLNEQKKLEYFIYSDCFNFMFTSPLDYFTPKIK